ncbi:MAG: two-component system LytT family sensor kinase [Oleiphilaceae bacterium]|uniref:sensor histidine kinase n=1 Tax=uncultured Paraglaciecola sp. TaxID=1765024 RepID=UPI0025DAE86F|nr:histidine kinase [uncultured Paraglaciecola sp.]
MRDTAERFIANQDKPSFGFLHSLGWMSYVFIFTADNVFFYRDINKLGIEVFFPLVLSGAFAALLTWPLRYVYQRCWGLPSGWLIITIVFFSFLVAVIWTPVKNIVIWYFYEDFDVLSLIAGNPSEDFRWYMLLMSLSYAFFMIFVWSTLYFGINYHFRLMHEKKLHEEAVRLSHISQIKMLRYQINPHFLFNTLNAISTLVLKGNKEKANGMLTRLATFLRFSLDNDPEKKIRLYMELKALMLYLEIEKTRFEDRLTVKFKIEPQTEALLVPSLLLQPLVENSIKYAIAQMPNGGLIKISAKCQRGYLQMEVADNGPAQNQPSITLKPLIEGQTASSHTGVGVQNIVDRLNVLYPNNHDFKVVRGINEGYCVQISIPMEYS